MEFILTYFQKSLRPVEMFINLSEEICTQIVFYIVIVRWIAPNDATISFRFTFHLFLSLNVLQFNLEFLRLTTYTALLINVL